MLNGEVLAVHCRGGVGRAGLLACCMMLYLHVAHSPADAICKVSNATNAMFTRRLRRTEVGNQMEPVTTQVRRLRCKDAVESRRQEQFIAEYHNFLQSTTSFQGQCDGSAPSVVARLSSLQHRGGSSRAANDQTILHVGEGNLS